MNWHVYNLNFLKNCPNEKQYFQTQYSARGICTTLRGDAMVPAIRKAIVPTVVRPINTALITGATEVTNTSYWHRRLRYLVPCIGGCILHSPNNNYNFQEIILGLVLTTNK